MDKKPRLGRGLNALLSVSLPEMEDLAGSRPTEDLAMDAATRPPSYEMFHVEHLRILPNSDQPRRQFNEESLQSLADSIKLAGVIQPIIVRRLIGTQNFEVIAGERRLRAAKLAGVEKLPVIVRDVDPFERSQFALMENIHREDLNPVERAQAYQSLIRQTGLTQLDLAERLGEDRSVIANHLRLLELDESVRQFIAEGRVSVGHAKLLAGVDDPAEQGRLGRMIVDQGLSVRKLEEMLKAPAMPVKQAKPTSAHFMDLERQISRDLQMRTEVRQAAKGGKGRIVIHYASLDQFDDLLHKLGVKIDD